MHAEFALRLTVLVFTVFYNIQGQGVLFCNTTNGVPLFIPLGFNSNFMIFCLVKKD